jgi:anti-sigma regulatory factor (Ser/Thr protein kinase)
MVEFSGAIELPCDPSAPSRARAFVRETLQRLRMPALAMDAELTISELVTNAVRHGSCDATAVRVTLSDGRVRIEVTDGNPAPPQQREPELDDPTGRGIRIINELATRWGHEPAAHGKTVWVELRTNPRA